MNPWYVFGPILAGWAVILSVIAITRERFPASRGVALAAGAITIILVILAIGAAIYGGIHESNEEDEGNAAAVLTL